MNNPIISVCIPVFSTEAYLAQCLRSVYTQDFDSFEVVVVSDASRGKDEKGRTAKKIVKLAQKESDKFRKEKNLPRVLFRFIEHKENRGLIEVRRSLCYEARGFYMTQCDSDDEMEAGALTALYKAAFIEDEPKNALNDGESQNQHEDTNFFDIVHGTSTAGTFDESGNFTPAQDNRYGKIFYGKIEGHDVFRRWLLNGDFTANTWGKLIKRELWVKAYENIPYTECNMADDVLLFFFLGQYAQSYIGIETKVYRYRVNTGMTSHRKIDTMHKWKMICSTASVFSVISTWIESQSALSEDEVNKIRGMTRYYLANNIRQMNEVVVPELKEKARSMLCEYWGTGFVEKMEAALRAREQPN
ncbi:glycosyltransferase family 2 protein [uncultured Treponema sp.]|uniref:glycosyltransferase family 2 protein n=1 Tax=uncultured Treponema sp. TaxID=162155 RepID=UPI0025D3A97D|nr:glycosyltransferase family 2 protein [uncultured Treponema sp.]